jgi:hypothetical protein
LANSIKSLIQQSKIEPTAATATTSGTGGAASMPSSVDLLLEAAAITANLRKKSSDAISNQSPLNNKHFTSTVTAVNKKATHHSSADSSPSSSNRVHQMVMNEVFVSPSSGELRHAARRASLKLQQIQQEQQQLNKNFRNKERAAEVSSQSDEEDSIPSVPPPLPPTPTSPKADEQDHDDDDAVNEENNEESGSGQIPPIDGQLTSSTESSNSLCERL